MKKTVQAILMATLALYLGCKKATTLPVAPAAEVPKTQLVTNAVIPDYAEYTISNVGSNKFLEVAGDPGVNAKYRNNALTEQYSASISNSEVDAWQRWYVIYRTTEGGVRYYQIRNSFSGKFLDVPAGSTTAGTQLQQYSEFPILNNEQLWKIVEVGTSGQYNIINKGNGLAVTNSGGSTNNGNPIRQQALGTGNDQKFTFNSQTPGVYRDDQVVNFFNRNNPSQSSTAFDQGSSVPLTDGRVLWITQDAWDGSNFNPDGTLNCSRFFSWRNSVLIQPSKTDFNPNNTPNMSIPNSTDNRPFQVFNTQPNTEWSWPGVGVQGNGNHVFVQVAEGRGLGEGVSQSLYDLTPISGNQWNAVRTVPTGFADLSINWASGMVKDASGYVYSYGVEGKNLGYGSNVYVARFHVNSPQAWEYWNGVVWQAGSTSKNGPVSTAGLATVAVTKVTNAGGSSKYVIMTMDNGFNCGDASRSIYIMTSSNPTGPFTAPVKVFTIRENLGGQFARYYTPHMHPEFINDRNELLMTYCLNFSACGVQDCVNNGLDPYYYRVKGIRLPYSKLGL